MHRPLLDAPGRWSRSLWLPLLCGLCACPGGDDDDDDGAEASCEVMAEHVEAICGEGFGSIEAATLRYDCQTFGYSASALRCVLAADQCDREGLGACDIHERTWVCGAGNEDCPPQLECNLEAEECTACDDDTRCETGQLCLSHWCVRDSDTNRQLRDILVD